MSRDRSIVPTNLLDWPRVSALLPDQRLILLWLWASPHMSCAGAGFLPLKPSAASLGLDPDALAGGLKTLHADGLIKMDEATGEVFIVDWFRFHTFKNGVGKNALVSAINKVLSESIKNEIYLKSTSYLPTATSTATSTSACKHAEVPACVQINKNEKPQKPNPTNPADRKEKVLVEGVQCWGVLKGKNEEVEEAYLILNKIGVEKFKKIVERCVKNGVPEPYLSEFKKELDKVAKAECLANSNKFNTSKDNEPPANPLKIREGGLMANIKKTSKK